MKNTLVDAGPVIALFDRNDIHHQRVLEFLKGYNGRLITTWPVITEISYMLDFHEKVRFDFFTWMEAGGIELFDLGVKHISRIREIMKKYADLPADLADASLLVVAEQSGINRILTIDRDFEIYRLDKGRKIGNVLAFDP